MKNRMSVTSMLPIVLCLFAASITVNGLQPTVDAAKSTSVATHEEIEQQILNELRQIYALLAKQQRVQEQAPAAPATQRATVSISGQSIGSKDAPVTLVEFADYNVHFASSSRPLSSIVLKGLHRHWQGSIYQPRPSARLSLECDECCGSGAMRWRAGTVLADARRAYLALR